MVQKSPQSHVFSIPCETRIDAVTIAVAFTSPDGRDHINLIFKPLNQPLSKNILLLFSEAFIFMQVLIIWLNLF